MRRGMILVVVLLLVAPCITACSSSSEGGSSTVVSKGTGSAPVEAPPDPGRVRPQVKAAGGGAQPAAK
jgi:hypothetical protein